MAWTSRDGGVWARVKHAATGSERKEPRQIVSAEVQVLLRRTP
jgi:hypothetical protein